MYSELFTIPFTHLTVKSYGLMLVIGFMATVSLIRRLSRDITPDPQLVTNAALYALLAGVVGARIFYVILYFQDFKDNLLAVFAVWRGGLVLFGGATAALIVIILYIRHHKLPVRKYLDIVAIGLCLALGFGRIGCFLNGCCFGKPTNLPWAVRFPYDSFAYRSQVESNLKRNRPDPQLKLPPDFFGYVQKEGLWNPGLKPYEDLTQIQKSLVKNDGPYRCLAVHPTQLYDFANGFLMCLLLYLFWRISQKSAGSFIKPGCTFSLMLILYGLTRFLLEFLRDDNPFEPDGLTVYQNIGIAMFIFGIVLMIIFQKISPRPLNSRS